MVYDILDIEELFIGIRRELLSEDIFPMLHSVTFRLPRASQLRLVLEMRAERLHTKQPGEQESLHAVACVRLEKEPRDEEQHVGQATNVSQPTEDVISLPSNDKSLRVKIYF